MNDNIHALIIALFFLYLFGKDLLEKILDYLIPKFGGLTVLKIFAFTLVPIFMICCLLNLKDDKWLIFHFLSYGCAFIIYYMYKFSKKVHEFLILKSGKRINSMTLFRKLKENNLLEGEFISFLYFLKQARLEKNDKLVWNDFEGEGKFIYKKILSLCILCHLEPERKYNDMKLSFYIEKLDPYFTKPDKSPLLITSDNVSKFVIKEDKNYNLVKEIFESCISN